MAKRRVGALVGETLREAGILVLVFGMLDKYVEGRPPTLEWHLWVIGVGLFGITLGCILETRSPE